MAQRLKNERSVVESRYMSQGFVTFPSVGMMYDLPLASGSWAWLVAR